MTTNKALDWENLDLTEVVAESAVWLRKAMSNSGKKCQAIKLVDAKLLELLWCPYDKEWSSRWNWKDVVRSDLSELYAPDGRWKNRCEWIYGEDRCTYPKCKAGELLARVLLSTMDWFFHCESKNTADASGEGPLLWVIAKIYDQCAGTSFFRTLSGMERNEHNYQIGQLLLRIPEADYSWFEERIFDFSTLMIQKFEDKEELDYCIICKDTTLEKYDPNNYPKGYFKFYNAHQIINLIKKEKAGELLDLREALESLISVEISEQLSQKILAKNTHDYLNELIQRKRQDNNSTPNFVNLLAVHHAFDKSHDVSDAIDKAKNALKKCFYSDKQPLKKKLISLIRVLCKDNEKDLLEKVPDHDLWKLANYFIWLMSLHPDLGSYTVRYASNYRIMPDSDSKEDCIRNSCLVIASHELPSKKLIEAARVSLTHCLGPLEDYYAKSLAKRIGEEEGLAMFSHETKNLLKTMTTNDAYSGWLGTLDKYFDIKEGEQQPDGCDKLGWLYEKDQHSQLLPWSQRQSVSKSQVLLSIDANSINYGIIPFSDFFMAAGKLIVSWSGNSVADLPFRERPESIKELWKVCYEATLNAVIGIFMFDKFKPKYSKETSEAIYALKSAFSNWYSWKEKSHHPHLTWKGDTSQKTVWLAKAIMNLCREDIQHADVSSSIEINLSYESGHYSICKKSRPRSSSPGIALLKSLDFLQKDNAQLSNILCNAEKAEIIAERYEQGLKRLSSVSKQHMGYDVFEKCIKEIDPIPEVTKSFPNNSDCMFIIKAKFALPSIKGN